MRFVFLFCVILVSTSCATLSNRSKTILSVVGAGVAVGTIAAIRAPQDEKPLAHAALWGGSTAALTGILGLYLFDEETKSAEANRKLAVAQRELDALRGESQSLGSQIGAESALERELPAEYRNLVKPGKWSLYKVNQWVSQGENTLVHQDKLLKIEPPQFQAPNSDLSPEGESK